MSHPKQTAYDYAAAAPLQRARDLLSAVEAVQFDVLPLEHRDLTGTQVLLDGRDAGLGLRRLVILGVTHVQVHPVTHAVLSPGGDAESENLASMNSWRR